MFTGIVEEQGLVVGLKSDLSNLVISMKASFISEIKVDQSISHNGVCLTVSELNEDFYNVVAIKETLEKSNLNSLKVGINVNLERCLKIGDRLDGHFVQGHVDATGTCEKIADQDGSWVFTFSYPKDHFDLIVDKGSICINGVSLTVFNTDERFFSVAIIPYTFEHTNFNNIHVGDKVNLEFDILGKYISRQFALSSKKDN